MTVFTLFKDIAEFYRRQAEVDHLERFDDHLLADIGLRREQLDLLRIEGVKRVPQPTEQRTAILEAGAHRNIRLKPAARPSLQGCG